RSGSCMQRVLLARLSSWLGLHQRTSSAGGDAPIHQQSLPGYITAGLGGKEHHSGFQISGLTGSLDWNPVAQVLNPFLVFIQQLVLFRAEPPWGKTIYCNSILPSIVRQAQG